MELLIWPPAHFRQKELIKKKKKLFCTIFHKFNRLCKSHVFKLMPHNCSLNDLYAHEIEPLVLR